MNEYWLVFTDKETGAEVRSEKPVSESYAKMCMANWNKYNECQKTAFSIVPCEELNDE